MALERMSVAPSDYVVLDVETNGLKCKEDDLLSISIYKPDDGKSFNRFLPLDLNSGVPRKITEINGIRASDLKGKKPLSQTEVDGLFDEFELDRRIILTYGSLDEKFIRAYFQRNHLLGYSRMNFYNFKHLICSTRFSDGSLTKDNLCNAFGIKGVTRVHSGMNDCVLEWKLFSAMKGRSLIAKMTPYGKWSIEVLSPDYIVPVSYLATYSNLSKLYPRPRVTCEGSEVFNLVVPGKDVKRFESNFSGMTLEHLMNTMLNVSDQRAASLEFMRQNAAKNIRLGYADHDTEFIPMKFSSEGFVQPVDGGIRHRLLARKLNKTLKATREKITPLVDYVQCTVFRGKQIRSQELSVDKDLGVLALCDLSTDDAVLEIKVAFPDADINRYAEQIYYEAHGREAYLLTISWCVEGVEFKLRKLAFQVGQKPVRKLSAKEKIIEDLNVQSCDLVEYFASNAPIRVRCRECGYEWETSYARIKNRRVSCPTCYPSGARLKKEARSAFAPAERPLVNRAEQYADKVRNLSGGSILVDVATYAGAKEKVAASCAVCGNVWVPRADHLLARCYCPVCRMLKKKLG